MTAAALLLIQGDRSYSTFMNATKDKRARILAVGTEVMLPGYNGTGVRKLPKCWVPKGPSTTSRVSEDFVFIQALITTTSPRLNCFCAAQAHDASPRERILRFYRTLSVTLPTSMSLRISALLAAPASEKAGDISQ
jgi:hypothetical protein